ncbi:hypothetical protein ACQFX9_28365 [Aliinostoc sp. HNIBRCY26]
MSKINPVGRSPPHLHVIPIHQNHQYRSSPNSSTLTPIHTKRFTFF